MFVLVSHFPLFFEEQKVNPTIWKKTTNFPSSPISETTILSILFGRKFKWMNHFEKKLIENHFLENQMGLANRLIKSAPLFTIGGVIITELYIK